MILSFLERHCVRRPGSNQEYEAIFIFSSQFWTPTYQKRAAALNTALLTIIHTQSLVNHFHFVFIFHNFIRMLSENNMLILFFFSWFKLNKWINVVQFVPMTAFATFWNILVQPHPKNISLVFMAYTIKREKTKTKNKNDLEFLRRSSM